MSRPPYCSYGSCALEPYHEGRHVCSCGEPCDDASPRCDWHIGPARWDMTEDHSDAELLAAIINRTLAQSSVGRYPGHDIESIAKDVADSVIKEMDVVCRTPTGTELSR